MKGFLLCAAVLVLSCLLTIIPLVIAMSADRRKGG